MLISSEPTAIKPARETHSTNLFVLSAQRECRFRCMIPPEFGALVDAFEVVVDIVEAAQCRIFSGYPLYVIDLIVCACRARGLLHAGDNGVSGYAAEIVVDQLGFSGSEDNAGGAGQEDSEDGSSAENKIEIVHTRDLSNPNATEKAQLIYDYLCRGKNAQKLLTHSLVLCYYCYIT